MISCRLLNNQIRYIITLRNLGFGLGWFTLLYFLPLLLSSCAQVVAPTGGPKDVKPPVVLNYSPPNKSTFFHAKKISITFNKYIQLKNANTQFVVSPPLKHNPIPAAKGKALEITLKDTLKDSTTYTFNFGNSVCDINESNVLKNFQYVVSTGSYIDSISFRGKMFDAFTHDPVKEGMVMLYTSFDDSVPFKKSPSYYGQSDDSGNFHIENIKPGNYKLISLSKGSGDYFYHPGVQSIAFEREPLNLFINNLATLYLFSENNSKLHLIKSKGYGKGEVMLVFNKAADSLIIMPINIDTSKKFIHLIQYSTTADTAWYWLNYSPLDSLRFIVKRNRQVIDTGVVYSFPGSTIKESKKNPVVPKLLINSNAGGNTFDYHTPILIHSANPLLRFALNRVKLLRKQDTIPFVADTANLPFSISLHTITPLLSDSSYKLLVLPKAFTDIYNSTNDTLTARFTIVEPTWFGSLKLTIRIHEKRFYLVQLLNPQNLVYRQDTITVSGSIFYSALPPANYRIRLINDANRNLKWDAGNYLKNIQPEMIYYYPDAINIRSNWDLTQSWDVND